MAHHSLCSLIHSEKSQTTQTVKDSWLVHSCSDTQIKYQAHTRAHAWPSRHVFVCLCAVRPGREWEDKWAAGRQKGGGVGEGEIGWGKEDEVEERAKR